MTDADDRIRLMPMSEAAYDRWLARTVVEYAEGHVAAGNWSAAGAMDRSRREFDELLPEGRDTPGQHLWTLEDEEGRDVGVLWAGPRRGQRADALFIWDFHVEPSDRGRGVGRRALVALEAFARATGMTEIGLHVFGANEVARRLYERSGYEVTDLMMRRRLDEPQPVD